MVIQLNSDNNILGTEGLSEHISSTLTNALQRYDQQITRVEVHLADENGNKSGGNDKRCTLEARLEGINPVVVSNHGDTIDHAVKGAIDKLKSSLESTLGRLKNH